MTELLNNIGDLIAHNPPLAYLVVFFGGTLSSANPCVIVTIPLVIGYVGGYAGDNKSRAFIYSLAFVAGLSITFTALGLFAGLLGMLFGDVGFFWRYLVAGVAVVMGLQLIGLFQIRLPGFQLERSNTMGVMGGFILGLLFGVVSSPCATPVLAVILTYVASKGNPVYGASLLFVYALGHCILMLAAGTVAGIARFMIESKGIGKFSMMAKRTSGVVIILAGLYLLFFPTS